MKKPESSYANLLRQSSSNKALENPYQSDEEPSRCKVFITIVFYTCFDVICSLVYIGVRLSVKKQIYNYYCGNEHNNFVNIRFLFLYKEKC
jgi:hypothetical protein